GRVPSRILPVRIVRRDASVDLLGHYDAGTHRLELHGHGFPLYGPGVHEVDGDLPWVFQDIAPSGFLAHRFAGWFPELGLSRDTNRWSVADTLRILEEAGHDLAGNLIVGDGSWKRYQRIFQTSAEPGPRREA